MMEITHGDLTIQLKTNVEHDMENVSHSNNHKVTETNN